MSLAIEIFERVGGHMYWVLKRSSIDPLLIFIAVARFIEVDWTGLAPLNTCLLFGWEIVELFKFPVVQGCAVSILLMGMFPTLVIHSLSALAISLLTGSLTLRTLVRIHPGKLTLWILRLVLEAGGHFDPREKELAPYPGDNK